MVPVTVTYQRNGTTFSSTLSPADTRIVIVSSELCQGAKLNSLSSQTTGVTASLYLLQNKPTLIKDNFTLTYTESLVLTNSYQYLSFHLYSGTKYSLIACLSAGSSSVTYLVIKGTSTFNQWVDSGSSYLAYSNSVLYLSATTSKCGTANSLATLTFYSEDDYYFVFDNINTATAFVTYTVAFDRYEYLPSSGIIVDSCSTALSATSCSLSFAYSSGYTVLVQTSSSPSGDAAANVDISVTCDARAWVYAVIEISMAIAVVLLAIPVLFGLFHYVNRNNAVSVPVVPSTQPGQPYPQAPTTQPYDPQVPTTVPYQQAPMGQPYPQTPMSQPYQQAPMGQPYQQAPMGQPFQQAPMGQPYPQTPMGQPFQQAPMGQPFQQGPPVPQCPMEEKLAAEMARFPPTAPPIGAPYPTAGSPPNGYGADRFDQPPPY